MIDLRLMEHHFKHLQPLRKWRVLLGLGVALFVLAASCKKYEEDSGVMLRTVDQRFTSGYWELQKYIVNGIDSTELKVFIAKRYNFRIDKDKVKRFTYYLSDFFIASRGGLWGYLPDKIGFKISSWTDWENPTGKGTPFYSRDGVFLFNKLTRHEMVLENLNDSTGVMIRLEFKKVNVVQ